MALSSSDKPQTYGRPKSQVEVPENIQVTLDSELHERYKSQS